MGTAIQEQIDKAAQILNSMMEDIHQEAFVSGAVSELTGLCLANKRYRSISALEHFFACYSTV